MRDRVTLLLNGQKLEIADLEPTTTVLQWLRTERRLIGTKEGCAEGSCGACTVVVGRCHSMCHGSTLRPGDFRQRRRHGPPASLSMIPAFAAATQPQGIHLVMTHSHDLDYAICKALLWRDDIAFLGLIGSKTKSARFK
jgi:xanthine/CO dehydrogenase XdhC/CoxF family maturation factor